MSVSNRGYVELEMQDQTKFSGWIMGSVGSRDCSDFLTQVIKLTCKLNISVISSCFFNKHKVEFCKLCKMSPEVYQYTCLSTHTEAGCLFSPSITYFTSTVLQYVCSKGQTWLLPTFVLCIEIKTWTETVNMSMNFLKSQLLLKKTRQNILKWSKS